MRKHAFCICQKQRCRSAVLMCRLISTSLFHFLDSKISLVISDLKLSSVAVQPDCFWPGQKKTKTGFLMMQLT